MILSKTIKLFEENKALVREFNQSFKEI